MQNIMINVDVRGTKKKKKRRGKNINPTLNSMK